MTRLSAAPRSPHDARPLAAVAVLTASFLAALAAAPWCFNAIVWLGRRVAQLDAWRDVEFESIAGYCVLVFLAAATIPAARLAGLRTLADLGLERRPGRARLLGAGFALGFARRLVEVLPEDPGARDLLTRLGAEGR